jgi:hypothetical protein
MLEQCRVCVMATNSRKRLAPHTVLQLCDSQNAETLQIYYTGRAAVVVFCTGGLCWAEYCVPAGFFAVLRCDFQRFEDQSLFLNGI